MDERDALSEMVKLADLLPGAFRAEVGLYYHAGVTGPEAWHCEVEGDLYGDGGGSTFAVWGSSPAEAVERATVEAWSRLPPRPLAATDFVFEGATRPISAARLREGSDGLEHAWTGTGTLCGLGADATEPCRHLFTRHGYQPPVPPPCARCVKLLPSDYPGANDEPDEH